MLAATLVALALTHASPSVVDDPAAAPSEEDDPRLAEARTLHDQGQAAYETYDYPSAIAAWTKAYASIEGHPRADQIRHAVVYNLAAARMAQYRVDGDKSQLGLAKRLLTKYSEALDRDAQAERAQVKGKIAEIDALLDERKPERTPTPTPPPPPLVDEPPPTRKPGTGLIIGGSIALAGGVGATIGMAIGLAQGRAADDALHDPMRPAADLPGLREDGQQANRVAIACGITAAVLVAAGTALVIVGAKRRKAGRGLVWRF